MIVAPARLAIHLALLVALAAGAAIMPNRASAAEPVVSVWYRGTPAGTPRQSDLGAIRALGFNGIVWPKAGAASEFEVTRLAGLVGLKVVVADRPVPITAETALRPPDRVDIVITSETSAMIMALAWRAVAHGARTIAFDSRSPAGAGLEEADGSLRTWVRTAISIARQLTANANLANLMRPGPGILVTPDSAPALDVVFLDGDRSWVIVATNTSSAKVAATVRLPTGTPYALWVSWLESPPLAMISEPAGPRWVLSMEPRSARVYIIDKIMK